MKRLSGSTEKTEMPLFLPDNLYKRATRLSKKELKALIINQICEEVDLADPIQVRRYTQIIASLSLENS